MSSPKSPKTPKPEWPKSPRQWGIFLGRGQDFHNRLGKRGLPRPKSIITGFGPVRPSRLITEDAHREWLKEMERIAAEFDAGALKGGDRNEG